jgi:hypothetical protein
MKKHLRLYAVGAYAKSGVGVGARRRKHRRTSLLLDNAHDEFSINVDFLTLVDTAGPSSLAISLVLDGLHCCLDLYVPAVCSAPRV